MTTIFSSGAARLTPLLASAVFFAAAPVQAQNVGIGSDTAVAVEEVEQAPAIPEVDPGAVPEGSVGGMGDINLYPKRVVIDRRQRIATVGIYNKTANPGEYEISIEDMVMTPEGNVFQLSNLPPGVSTERLSAAGEMLRWSPRRVALLANEAQTVRIMARPPADLPDGEYRSHFMAVSVPTDVDEGFSIEDAVGDGSEGGERIGVTIRPRFGISIPVILRIGETTLDVGMQDIALVQTQDGPAVMVVITRSGTRSAYGDMIVSAPGSSVPVAIARGVGVYPEVDSRRVVMAINPEYDLTQLRSGMVLSVSYIDDDYEPGVTLASQDFVVP